MGRKLKSVGLLFTMAGIVFLWIGFSSNPPNGRTGAPGESTCASCHTENNPNGFDGNLSIDGIPATILPNTTYSVTVTASNPNGLASQAGFQWVALKENNTNAGFLANPSAGSTVSAANGRLYHEHNPAKAFLNETEVDWMVNWTTPDDVTNGDTITIYGISVFGDGGTNQGDQVVQTKITFPVSTTLPLNVEFIDTINLSCFGLADGQVTAQGTNGTPPYTYEWSNGSLDSIATNLAAGTYSVTVTDSVNTVVVDSIVIESPDSLYLELVSQTNIDCNNDFGSIEVTAIGGTPAYHFLWSNGDSTAVIDSLAEGLYSVIVQDTNLCADTLDISILSNTVSPSFSLEPAPILNCISDSVMLQVASINCDTCSFAWSSANGHIASGANTTTPIVTTPGTYVVTITDEDNGCTSISQQVVMADLDLPSVNAGTNDTLSCGEPQLVLNGMVSNCSNCVLLWMTQDGEIESGANTLTPIINAPGTYVLTALNPENGCVNSDAVSIFQTSAPALTLVDFQQISCNGLSDGLASVLTIGGQAPYQYEWSNGGTGPIQSGLTAGNYGLTLTDDAGCTDSLSFTVNEPPPILLMTANTPETAFAANDGTASAMASGGTPPFQYQWSNGSTSASIQNLAPGLYTVIVTDANGCTEIAAIEIEPFFCLLNAVVDFNSLDCNGDQNGQASVTLFNEVNPVVINWSNGGSGLFQNNLPAGPYAVSITDGSSCTVVESFEIDEPEALLIELSSLQHIACNGSTTGAARVEVSGGNPEYSYLWSNGSTDDFISNVLAGTYTVTVTDANDCQETFAVTLTQPPFLELSITGTNETALGAHDGIATPNTEGGVPPYQFQWSNGSTNETAESLAPGTYQLTVTDQNDCTIHGAVIINAFNCPVIFIDSEYTPLICPGSQSGIASVVEVPGANQPVTYLWSNGSTDSTIMNLSGGMYLVTITDATNCAVIDVFDIFEGDPNGPTALAQNITLQLDANGSAGLDPTEVDNGSFDNCGIASMALSQSQFDCSDIGQQSITFTVTDGPGNISIKIVTVTVLDNTAPEILNCPASPIVVDCNEVVNYPDLIAEDNCPVTFTLLEGQASGTLFPVGTTTVTYEAEDEGGNTTICSFQVTTNSDLDFTAETTPVSCSGGNDGQIEIMPEGGVPPYTIIGIPVNVTAGTYSISVTDNQGCSITKAVTVGSPPSLFITIEEISPATMSQSNGAVDITAVGGTGALSFLWRDAAGNDIGFEEDISNIPAGIYFVWVTDENNCFIILEVEVDPFSSVRQAKLMNQIQVFPNPSDGYISIQTAFGSPVSLACSVYDIQGQLLTTEWLELQQNHQHPLDLRHLPNGVYLLQFQAEGEVLYQRIFINH